MPTKNDFDYWKKQHDSENLTGFNSDIHGQLWLKLKSIIRRELIEEFCTSNSIILSSTTTSKQFSELFEILAVDADKAHSKLDTYIRKKNLSILDSRDQEKLVSELYKLRVFEWRGDYQNSRDKYLVTHYVKAISSYEVLVSKFEIEINRAVQGYVLNSWYNHWSSILIEHIFKSHGQVLPTVGQIKSVDFFIRNIPFDLKVTYFPSEYLKQKRKEKGLPVELTYLKAKARELQISFDAAGSPAAIHYEIREKLKDRGDKASLGVLEELKSSNMNIVDESIKNPSQLAKWLYENQGEMRFGSENRIFLVLIDTDDFTNSWKLKRNLDLLRPNIHAFLDTFSRKTEENLKVVFNYPGRPDTFSALADVVFVKK